MKKLLEQEKERLFEKVWSEYWWTVRSFGYRVTNSEIDEREALATMFDTFINVYEERDYGNKRIDTAIKGV